MQHFTFALRVLFYCAYWIRCLVASRARAIATLEDIIDAIHFTSSFPCVFDQLVLFSGHKYGGP